MQNGQQAMQWASAQRAGCLITSTYTRASWSTLVPLAFTLMRLLYRVAHAAVQVCVVSRGSKSCLVCTRNGEHLSCDPPEVTVVDTVGAGDCFAAGFLHAYIGGASLQVTPPPTTAVMYLTFA